MYMPGKTHNIEQEMKRLGINILGISETRWPGSGKIRLKDAVLFNSGNEDTYHYNGVGIMMDLATGGSVINFVPLSDRAMMVQLSAKEPQYYSSICSNSQLITDRDRGMVLTS